MNFRAFTARFALLATLCLSFATPAQAQFWQCARYAREISDVKIRGNADTWWSQAAGRYERGNTPEVGAVMAFEPTRKMRFGHVAMVSRVVSDREVMLTHANWSRPGGIERDVRAVDVSPNGDWSEVKVWYGPIGDLGTSSYAIKGFIYPDDAPAPVLETPFVPQAVATLAAGTQFASL